ncbi:MAG: peptidase [Hyphomicrobiales bacterium]|nr:peptidase [Hyphomicrobiales bacterium]MCP5370172.1 peptidase [Hyphomicrobiales bacterium]
MTYCIGLCLDEGLVMLADTRTNAGVDNISTFRKMTVWEKPGERVIALMSAGNLAVSQGVVNLLNEGIEMAEAEGDGGHGRPLTLMTVPSMFQATRLVGQAVRQMWEADGAALEARDESFNVSLILAGQIGNRRMRMFQIYAAGNFIEATTDTPYFQIGEHKYGKPILDRAVSHDIDLTGAVKLSLVSMDSTTRSNLSVGMPLDLMVYRKDTLRVAARRRIGADDLYYIDLAQRWSVALKKAFVALPDPPWLHEL